MPLNMVTLDSDVFKCCHKVETLGWHNDGEAKSLLQRAADQVKPIMVRRKWAVPLLVEFYPPMPNLLGMNHNHGERIEIRVRSPSDPSTFLSYESILGTLLHELAHIEVGPHNAQFYKLLDELQDECDTLVAQGVVPGAKMPTSGGMKLGGGSVGRAPPRHIAQQRGTEAALRRQRIGRLMPRGGQVLGGDAQLTQIAALCDPREMAVAAAERRLADEVWCSNARVSAAAPQPVVIDIDAGDEIVVINDDNPLPASSKEDESTRLKQSRPPPRPAPARRRDAANRVPVRQNPAALAALQRASATGRPRRR